MPRAWILGIAAALPVLAQVTTGSISGYVLDPSRRSIPNATVTAIQEQRGFRRSSRTDSAGAFRFAELPPAKYILSASAAEFTDAMVTVRLEVDAHLRVDLFPAVAGARQSVQVSADVRTLPSESSELGAVIGDERMQTLPLNRRDFLQLALLIPGVLPPVQDSELSTRGAFAMHANGGREEFNNFLLDGVDNNDQNIGRYVLQPPVDAIQEFKIVTNSYSAEYGRSGGAQVNIVTRGGANHWRGTAYEYFRNRALDARNFFDGREKAQYARNQIGAGAGGPLIRGRTFIWANFDALRERRGFSRLATVPPPAERDGDLSGVGRTVSDPFTGAPFPGNRIPAARIDPLARRVLELFPLPNRPGASGNFLGQPAARDSQSQAGFRVDHRLTTLDQLTLRYNYGNKSLFEPFAEESTDLPGFGDYPEDRGHNAMIHHQRTFSSRTVNSLLIGLNRATRRVLPENHGTDVNRLWNVSYLPTEPRDFGYPGIVLAGYSRAGDVTQLPIDRATTTYQISEVLSLIRGKHGLKIGGEFRKLPQNGFVRVFSRGQISLSGALSGAGIGDLLLGLPSLGIKSTADNPQTQRTSSTGVFVQDDWKLRPDLTLNLGIRYEYNTPATDPTNRMSAFNLASGQIAQAGTNGISRSGIRADRNNAAPRAGFAWTPAHRLVIRGGYGVFYDAGTQVVNSSLYFNPPFFTIRVYFPTQSSLLRLSDPFPSRGGISPPASLSTLSPDIATAYLQTWNLNVQREVPAVGAISVAYAGSKGTHLIRARDLNQPGPGPGDVAARVPYRGFGNIFFIDSGANSNFHSLQASLNRPLSRQVSVLAAYTFSKSIDGASAFLSTKADKNFPQDSRNYGLERAVSSFDIRQRVAIAAVYRITARSIWLRNTDAQTIVTMQSGQPFTPLLRFDNSNTGNSGGQNGSDRPDLLRNPTLSAPTPSRWFDTSALAVPARYTFGTAGRNILRGPGVGAVDFSLARRFTLRESTAIQIEGQAFNLLNRTNLDLPERFADEPSTFGRVFSAKSPRQVQIVVRLQF